ncbi:class I SAM-dependent methyltransferase [Geminocystis sp. CENA526]|uniref:class I SAM-dependent methyltransferase n=1 Tax=Geminocystis sp. CENA526 TaxID=1355871 RepID=UPI003D6FAB85
MKKYGKDINSKEAWDEMAKSYSEKLANEYHKHRLDVINSLIPEELYQTGKNIFDFGCGDAIHFEQFLDQGVKITGVDISPEIITLAKERLCQIKSNPDLVNIGGVSFLSDMKSSSLDAILSFNVLAYLTNEEEEHFYKEASRVLRQGGYLIVTHSNELFDMYSMNQYTVDFLSRHLITDGELKTSLSKLIIHSSEKENVSTYNVRENPLNYQFKLAKYGFKEQRQEFINLHPAPPHC